MIDYDKAVLEEIFHEVVSEDDVANETILIKLPLDNDENGDEISLHILAVGNEDKTPNLVLNKFGKDFYLYVLLKNS